MPEVFYRKWRPKVFSDIEYQEIQNNPPLNASEVSDINGLKTTS